MTGLLDPASPLGMPPPALQAGDVESAVHASLSEIRLQGALLVGPPGIGKTRTIEDALERYIGTFHIERLLCTTHLAQQPYGSLLLLATDADGPLPPDPLEAYGVISRALRERAGDRPVLLVVDNCDRIDELSASLVTQLVREHAISLLAATDTLTPPADLFTALWCENRIRRIDLSGMDRDSSRRLLERTLGAPVSPRSVDMLATATGGNPQLLIELVRHQRRQGTLQLHEGTWILAAPLDYTGIQHIHDSRLARLSPIARDLVLMIAMVEAVPLSAVLRIAEADVLSSLLATGLLHATAGPPSTVRLAERVLSEMLAHSIPPARRLRLWETLQGAVDIRTLPPVSRFGFARCAVRCHTRPDPWLVATGASHAFERGDAHQVLELAAHADCSDPRLKLQVARSLRMLGRFDELEDVLRHLDGHPDPEIAEGAHRVRLSLTDPFTDLPGPSCGLPEGASPLLRIAHAHRHQRGGRFDEVIAICETMRHDLTVPPATRAMAAARQGEALITKGAVAEGLGHATRALQMLELSSPSVVDRLIVHHCLYRSFLLAGAPQQTQRVIDSMRSLGATDSGAQVISGIEALRRGRIPDALTVLSACAGELERADPLGLRGVTDAARRLAHKFLRTESPLPVARPVHPPSPRDWLIERITRFLQLAELGRTARTDAARGMEELAREIRAEGGVTAAVHVLIQAANHDSASAARELAALPVREGEPIVALGRVLGIGIERSSVPDLLEATSMAEAMGDVMLAHDTAGRALVLAREGGERAQIRTARARAARAYRLMRQARGLQRPAAPLSTFELELAEAAATGATSQQLGARFHLSPRTVEWHLDKIYQRLHVGSRAELRKALDDDRGRA